jgi:hypothetical protein
LFVDNNKGIQIENIGVTRLHTPLCSFKL